MTIVWFKLALCGCLLFLGSDGASVEVSVQGGCTRERVINEASEEGFDEPASGYRQGAVPRTQRQRADLGSLPYQEDPSERGDCPPDFWKRRHTPTESRK